jgi:TRAP-type mannitol/chloroaromatic compound transport system substrate-binding protein
VIDATEWVGPYNDLAFGFHQVAKYYYYPGWHEPGSTLELTVNKPAYESLPADLQAIIETAARAVNQDMLDEYTARNNTALEELVNVHGVEVRKLPDEVIQGLRKLSVEAVNELTKDNEFAQRVSKSIEQFKRQVTAYHGISEEAFYKTRQQ